MKHYDEKFYNCELESSRRSAKEIVPLILELITPESVIDVGCGAGAWLALFKQYGVEDVFGVDGAWINQEELLIPKEQFISFDLTKPFRINREFGLVISLEVAEHIPAKHARTLIDTLVSLGPVVLFSAAIPFQGGTHHVNEQWPNYWAKLFSKRGYVTVDCIRKRIWLNDNIESFYAQNMLMFVRKSVLEHNQLLKKEFEDTNTVQLSIVHPKVWLAKTSAQRKFRKRLIQFIHKVIAQIGKRTR